MIFFDDKDELFSEPLILQEKDRKNRNYRNNLDLFNLQLSNNLKISKREAWKSHIYDGFGREIVDE